MLFLCLVCDFLFFHIIKLHIHYFTVYIKGDKRNSI